MLKNILKYTVVALIAFTLVVVFQLDGMTKTIVSKGLFIGLSIAEKCFAEGSVNVQKITGKKLMKDVCKLPKYIGEGLV